MTPEQTARLRADAVSAGQAAAAAGAHAAILAVGAAAENAAKPGGTSSEFKATMGGLGGILTVGLLAALHVFTVIPGPWMIPALALSAAVTVGSYALSRGSVKSAALAAAGAAVSATATAVAQTYVPVVAVKTAEGTRVATTNDLG